MKFANVNTPGASFSYRAEADYALQFPQLSLAKQIVEVERQIDRADEHGDGQRRRRSRLRAHRLQRGRTRSRRRRSVGRAPGWPRRARTSSAISAKGDMPPGESRWGDTRPRSGRSRRSRPKGDAGLCTSPSRSPPRSTPPTRSKTMPAWSSTKAPPTPAANSCTCPAENIDPLRDREANVAGRQRPGRR